MGFSLTIFLLPEIPKNRIAQSTNKTIQTKNINSSPVLTLRMAAADFTNMRSCEIDFTECERRLRNFPHFFDRFGLQESLITGKDRCFVIGLITAASGMLRVGFGWRSLFSRSSPEATANQTIIKQ
jgi:hypothetical protein